MAVKQFEPTFMKISVLTAALQELTPREVRDRDPDRAIEEWLQLAREVGADNIELSAAPHPTESDIPADAMLDPVANTLDLRQAFDKRRAQRVFTAMKETKVGLSDLGYFDNMLHDDPTLRRKKFDFMMRVFDAAILLENPAVVIRRSQPEAADGPEPADVRGSVHPPAQGGKGARHRVPCRAMSNAWLDHARQFSQ